MQPHASLASPLAIHQHALGGLAALPHSLLSTAALSAVGRLGTIGPLGTVGRLGTIGPLGTVGRLGSSTPSVNINLNALRTPSSALLIIIVLTLLSVAPSLLVLLTGFTRIFIVLGLTRNAIGLQTTPPNQVLAGLALFLSLFVMAPVLSQIDHQAVQPYLHGTINATQAISAAESPLRTWMLRQTGTDELTLFTSAAHEQASASASLPMTTVIPAFVLSEVQSAMLIGFIVFIPFLVIDLVVASILMSMGMYMLPPSLVSLPFKILLFVLVDGWTLVVHSALSSFR